MQYLFLFLSAIFLAPAVLASDPPEEIPTLAVDNPPIKLDNVIETVIIDTMRYQVPEPWTGNRQFPTSRTLDELKQIPREFTHEGSEIYILAEAYPSMLALFEQARLDGIDLKVESGYRSIHYQTRIFMRMLKQGRTFDDIVRYVAPPGYSQHMLGTAMDFYPSNWEFAETEQYRWLQENGPRFGFEETYSKNNRYRMPWEAWHWNYIGVPEITDEALAEGAALEDEAPVPVDQEQQEPVLTGQQQMPVPADQQRQEPVLTDQQQQEPVLTDQQQQEPVPAVQEQQKPALTDQQQQTPVPGDQEEVKPAPIDDVETTATQASKIVERDLGPLDPVGSTLAEGAALDTEQVISN